MPTRQQFFHLDESFVTAVRARARVDWRTLTRASDLGQAAWLNYPEIVNGTGPCPVIITRTSSRLRRLARAIGYAGPIKG